MHLMHDYEKILFIEKLIEELRKPENNNTEKIDKLNIPNKYIELYINSLPEDKRMEGIFDLPSLL